MISFAIKVIGIKRIAAIDTVRPIEFINNLFFKNVRKSIERSILT